MLCVLQAMGISKSAAYTRLEEGIFGGIQNERLRGGRVSLEYLSVGMYLEHS